MVLAFIDAEKGEYASRLRALEDVLGCGGILAAHNVVAPSPWSPADLIREAY